MLNIRNTFIAGILLLCSAFTQAAIQTKEVTYKSGDTTLKGFMAWDDAIKGKVPGVLVVHEWWGHNAYSRKRATQLAEMGYVGFALDMYGDGKSATHPEDATAMYQAVMQHADVMRARFDAALAALKQQPQVDASHIGAIGYCMGGTIVIQMAREGADLDLVASFHGGLSALSKAQKGQVKAEVLVFNGEADSMITPDQVTALKQEMHDAGAAFTYVGYPGAKHSFTNPDADAFGKKFNMPLAYDAKADADSWAKMQAAMKHAFAK